MGKKIGVFILFFAVVSVCKLAEAKKKKSKKIIVSFEEDLVEGNLTGADLFLVLQKDQENFNKLFKLRKNFLKELKRDSNSIK